MRAPRRSLSVAVLACTTLAASACFDPEALPEMTFAVDEADVWPERAGPGAPAPGEGRVVVTNNLDDTVSILDLDLLLAGEPSVLATVPVGFVPVEREGPHHIAIDASVKRAYLGISNYVPGSGSGPHGIHGSGTASGHLVELDVESGRQLRSVRVDRNPGDVRLTPDGKRLLATHYDLLRINQAFAEGIESGPELDSRLAIVDVETFEREALVPTCPAAHGMAITADSSLVIVSCNDDSAAIVDLEDDAHPVTRIELLDEPGTALRPLCGPYAVTIDESEEDGGARIAWVSCFGNGRLIAVDLDSKTRDGRELQLTGRAVFGDVQNHQMVIAQQDSDAIAIIDLTVPTIVSTRSTVGEPCSLPHYVRYADDGASLLVVCEGTKSAPGSLLVLEREAPWQTRSHVELGLFPDDMSVARRPQ